MEPVFDHKVTQILLWRHHQAGAVPVWRPQLLQKAADDAAVGTLHGAWGEGLQVQVLFRNILTLLLTWSGGVSDTHGVSQLLTPC